MKALICYGAAVALHVAVATGVLLHQPRATRSADSGWTPTTLDIEPELEPVPTSATFRDAPAAKAMQNATPVHVVAVAAKTAAIPQEDAVPDVAPTAAPVRFHAIAAAAVIVAEGAVTVDESEVTERARCIYAPPPAYPPTALDEDVAPSKPLPFQLVVDTEGLVVEARPLDHAGHGFDESAMAALRRYRFTPAKRNGEPVRVRMLWSVEFRLGAR